MPDDLPDDLRLFAKKYNIPSVKAEPSRWNKEWDKLLPTLSSKDVFTMLSPVWEPGSAEYRSKFCELALILKDDARNMQGIIVKLWDDLESQGGHFVSAWMLLEDGERRRHLLEGLVKACGDSSWVEDSRALCPEITFSCMLKQRGMAFIDFVRNFTKGTKDVRAGGAEIYSVPSEWWTTAVDVSEPVPEEDKLVFTLLTLRRDIFIGRFLQHTICSVLHDLVQGSPGMNPVIKMMESDANFARIHSEILSVMRDKPVIRCQNCTKSPEEIGNNAKFMVCSGCKKKLDFSVHYCSQACQTEDWRNHKKHCGKERVSKTLRDTAQDPFWAFPDFPDHLRVPSQDGLVSMDSLGFGTPDAAHPHSPALQRQVSLMTGDKSAEYFLFDEMERPIRCRVGNMLTKIMFRTLRADAIYGSNLDGLPAIAEYLIKAMAGKPGLSRERILAQLSSEYGVDVGSKVTEFQQSGKRNGYSGADGITFLELTSQNLMTSLPHLMKVFPG